MTAKQFFHGKAFKCIIVILIIVLVCGIFLTFCNSLFAVSDEERTDRAIAKLYTDETVHATDITEDVPDTVSFEYDYSTITTFYSVDNGDYVVKASGKGGYGGNVVTWVVVKDDGAKVTGIGTVLAQSSENSGESFLSNLSDANFEQFSEDYVDGIIYSYGYANGSTAHGDMYISTGASKSYRGVCNAVNGAIEFVNNYLAAIAEASEEVAA